MFDYANSSIPSLGRSRKTREHMSVRAILDKLFGEIEDKIDLADFPGIQIDRGDAPFLAPLLNVTKEKLFKDVKKHAGEIWNWKEGLYGRAAGDDKGNKSCPSNIALCEENMVKNAESTLKLIKLIFMVSELKYSQNQKIN